MRRVFSKYNYIEISFYLGDEKNDVHLLIHEKRSVHIYNTYISYILHIFSEFVYVVIMAYSKACLMLTTSLIGILRCRPRRLFRKTTLNTKS